MAWLRSLLVLLWLALVPTTAFAQAEIRAAPPPAVEATWEVPPAPAGWDEVIGPYTRIHGPIEDDALLLALSRHAEASLLRLARELDVPIGDTIHIYVAPTKAAFRAMQPGNAPSWADGVAYPALGVIYLHGPRARDGTAGPITQVLDHELVHVILGRAFYPHPTPLWLQEGVARVLAGEVGPDTTEALAQGLLVNAVMPLSALDRSFPEDPVRARLAYAQSADLIGWIREEHGREALPQLIKAVAAGDSLDDALRSATGQRIDQLETEWRARFDRGVPLKLTALTDGGIWWGLGGVALLVGGILRRRRFHARLAEMEAQENLVDELVAKLRADREEQAVRAEWEAWK